MESRMLRNFAEDRLPVRRAVDDCGPGPHDMDVGKGRDDPERKPKVVAQ